MTVRLDPSDSVTPLLYAAESAAHELTRRAPDFRIVVAWLSRHAAAMEHVLFPAARRELPSVDIAVEVDRTRRLEHLLLQVHRALNGDGRAAEVDISFVTARLHEALAAHVSGVRTLLAQLSAALPDDAWSAFVARLDGALQGAPSRPHPHTPHGRVAERFAFAVAAAADRLLDELDSRIVPSLPTQREATGSNAPTQPA